MRAKSNIGPDEGGFPTASLKQNWKTTQASSRRASSGASQSRRTAREVLAEAEEMDEQRSPREEAVEFLKKPSGQRPGPCESKFILPPERKESHPRP